MHGGPPVSKDGVLLEEIALIDRYGRQPGQEGLMCELLWTDPQEEIGRGPSKRVSCDCFELRQLTCRASDSASDPT